MAKCKVIGMGVYAPGEALSNEEVKKLLDERLASHKANPNAGESWENVKKRIKDKL